MNKLRFMMVFLIAIILAIPPGAGLVEARSPANTSLAAYVPVGGTWKGKTNLGYLVQFTINSAGTSWSNFFLATTVTIGGCTANDSGNVVGPGTITNGQFSGTGGSTFSFTGTFTSATTATGTYNFTNRSSACGAYSQSGTWTATVVTKPSAFSKSKPSNGATNQALKSSLSWTVSTGATSYRYCFDTVNDNACNTSWISVGKVTTVTPASGFLPGRTYYWQVVAMNSVGSTAANSGTWWSFKTVNAPLFSATPSSWNYGVVKVGTTTAGKSFTIKNTGTANLSIGTVSLAGATPGQFHITANGCSGHTLAPSGTCMVTTTFKPTTAGTKSAYLNFPDNAAGSPHKISLSGKGGVQLALNGGFNTYPTTTAKIPTYWKAVNFASTDGKNTTYKYEGTASVRMGNTAAKTKTLTQTRSISGGAGNSFVLSLWAKGQSIPTTAGVVRAQVLLYNGTTLVQSQVLSFSTGSYSFMQKRVGFTAKGAYTKVVIRLTYSKASGAVWFDGLSLLRSP